MTAHEPQPVRQSSDRTFGLVMSAFFLLAGVWPLVHGQPIRVWMVILAAAFLAFALVYARALHPLNRLWTLLAILLHRIVSPVVLAILFYVVVTPVALGMRMFKRDALRLRTDPSAPTYWLPRQPPGPPPESMVHQF